LQMGATLVVELVDRLQGTAVDQKQQHAGLVERYRRKVVQPNIHRRDARGIRLSRGHGTLRDDLQGVMGGVRHDPHLVNGGLVRLDMDGQPRWHDVPMMLRRAADGLLSGRQQIASLFVELLGQPGMAQEAGGIGLPGGAGGEIAPPSQRHLSQRPLRHLGGLCGTPRSFSCRAPTHS
jgi:hypothetical protein